MPGICRIPPEERWERCRELLLLADPDPLMVERYLPACEMLALCEGEKVLSEVCVEQPEAGDWGAAQCGNLPGAGGTGLCFGPDPGSAASGPEGRAVAGGGHLSGGSGLLPPVGICALRVRRGFLQYQEPVLENGTVLEDMQMLRWSKEETEWTL